ncbi:MAG: non-canonical purine NTP pyrophosphatase, RdgB/HAM1 family [Rhodospirillaceae bacterium]|nr:non-canonical purine NTP pyrophosphatase, RdgB/HAM1 family [Rhodospirillaceae bacterium]
MARKFDGGKLVIATHNSGKVVEIADLLAPFGADLVSAGKLGLPEPEETGSSFIANAELKALAATKGSGFPALADDSGLVVPTLGGDPGIYSARWAGPSKNFQSAMRKVEDGLRGEKDRTSRFVSALTLAWPDGHTVSVEGTVRGELTWPPRGDRGFGYDPVFVPVGYDITFGEMDPVEKHQISHRADAFRKLVDLCLKS